MQADESASHSQVAIRGQFVIHRLAHKPASQQGNTKKLSTLNCTNCCRRDHRAKDTTCPALNQTYSLCGNLGHLKRVCRSGPAAKPAHKQRNQLTRALQTKVNVLFSTQFISSVVKNKNRRVCAEFYVLPPRCSAIIGQNLISALGLQIDGATMEIRAVTRNSVDITHEYPRLLSNELGTFPDYQHDILFTDDAVPPAQKLRPVPLARRQKVYEEVQSMDDLGIWDAADKSSSIHHMVTFLNLMETTELQRTYRRSTGMSSPTALLSQTLTTFS
ncbi:transposon ty3-i Gag-Pol polyprotein [Plakobranchus ocellatus]|uniref:Transposon ty3-i Gag-Pol polyprotein n=1 Tax=Plakobranchus ocellatus TaxID=259542 RepID=A0AAV3ZEP6_9GAST|nr:transposon ty3-i Gag-Pol polyprotein [Plakobranchus ocellatus]